MRTARLTLVLALVTGLTSQAVFAHRLNLTTSEIVWQPDEHALEITHALHLDDALTLLARLGVNDGVLDLPASARLMRYIAQRFQLTTGDVNISLEPYGAHIDDGVLYVYQKALVAALPTALQVTNRILHDVIEDAQNQVNWRVGDVVRSRSGGPVEPVIWLTLAANNNATATSQPTTQDDPGRDL